MIIKSNNIILCLEHPRLFKDVKYLLTSYVSEPTCGLMHDFASYIVLAWFCTLHSSCPPPSILVLTKLMHDCAYYIILAWFCTLHNSCPPPSILVLTKLMHDCAYYIFPTWLCTSHNSCPSSSILVLIKKIKKN
jgi:hypothetical protein